MNLHDLKPAPFNPRTIDDEAAAGLRTSIEKFGDISGIVWNKRNGFLVAGHQRLKAMRASGYVQIARVEKHGIILETGGGEFPVRTVDWDDDTHKAAMIAANSEHISGAWDMQALDTMRMELHDHGYDDGGLRLDCFTIDDTVSGTGEAVADEPVETHCPKCGYSFGP